MVYITTIQKVLNFQEFSRKKGKKRAQFQELLNKKFGINVLKINTFVLKITKRFGNILNMCLTIMLFIIMILYQ